MSHPFGKGCTSYVLLILCFYELLYDRMKDIQSRQVGLRARLRNNQREVKRLMTDYENCGSVIVRGSDGADMAEWLQQDRPRRRAAAEQSPNALNCTQTTDASTQPSQTSISNSQISDAASEALRQGLLDDDYTGSSEEEENEERSVNTESGLPDTQASDSPYQPRNKKRKRKEKKSKKGKKERKGHKKGKKDGDRSGPSSPSY